MGPRVSHPVTKKYTDARKFQDLEYCTMKMQNMEPNFFDFILATKHKNHHIFAILGGQGQESLSKYLKLNLISLLQKNENFKKKKFKLALEEITTEIDRKLEDDSEFKNLLKKHSSIDQVFQKLGSTIIITIIDSETKKIHIANLGNSKAILFQKKFEKVESVVEEHNPENTSDMMRIRDAGLFTDRQQLPDNLNCTRGIGFLKMKTNSNLPQRQQAFINNFSFFETDIKEEIDSLLIGSRSFFGVLNDEEIMELCKERQDEGKSDLDICEEIMDRSCPSSSLNVSSKPKKINFFHSPKQ